MTQKEAKERIEAAFRERFPNVRAHVKRDSIIVRDDGGQATVLTYAEVNWREPDGSLEAAVSAVIGDLPRCIANANDAEAQRNRRRLEGEAAAKRELFTKAALAYCERRETFDHDAGLLQDMRAAYLDWHTANIRAKAPASVHEAQTTAAS